MQYLSPFPGFRKTRILSRREEELRHALRSNLDPRKVQRAAERVRTAKLHLLKALQHSAAPCCAEDPSSESRLQNIQKEIDFWEQRPAKDIIDEYKNEKRKWRRF